MKTTTNKTDSTSMNRYQFKISLSGVRPMIWRRVIVPANYTMAQFHEVIQASMGWENYHLYSFTTGHQIYDDEAGGLSTPLNALHLSANDKFHYVYDFGDNWEHLVVLEKILPADKQTTGPTCLAGKRACPPEDCGGIWGYQEKLAISTEKDSPEYEDLMEWLGEPLRPDHFDLKETNARLKELVQERVRHA